MELRSANTKLSNEELNEWLSDIYTFAKARNWSYKDVASEIATSGFDDDEISFLIKETIYNETFNIK